MRWNNTIFVAEVLPHRPDRNGGLLTEMAGNSAKICQRPRSEHAPVSGEALF